MVQSYVCDCLNVTLKYDEHEKVRQSELDQLHRQIELLPDKCRAELSHFLSNSKLVKTHTDGIRIKYDFLCFKRVVENWQVNYCAVCEKEVFATLTKRNLNYRLVLVNASLLNDENHIELCKNDSNYSPALGIKLPMLLPSSDEKRFDVNQSFNLNDAWCFTPKDITLEIDGNIKHFLSRERFNMEERIRIFTLEQNDKFQELCHKTNETKNEFFRIVEAIKQRYNISNDLFDKENKNKTRSDKEPDKPTFVVPTGDDGFVSYSSEKKESPEVSKHRITSDDFDGPFDMDDIDVDSGFGPVHSHDRDEELAIAEEKHDIFPLKESNAITSDMQFQEVSNGIEIRETRSRSRKMAASVHQNVPMRATSSEFTQHTPNSLPIQIPHIPFSRSRKLDPDMDEDLKPGESIADSIQKLARSVRNEHDILDDRPSRRRLNTGDLIKSRPFY